MAVRDLDGDFEGDLVGEPTPRLVVTAERGHIHFDMVVSIERGKGSHVKDVSTTMGKCLD